MPRFIKSYLSPRATEYFGGDVRRFWIERDSGAGTQAYRLYQLPRRGRTANVAMAYAMTAREARKVFNDIADEADSEHA